MSRHKLTFKGQLQPSLLHMMGSGEQPSPGLQPAWDRQSSVLPAPACFPFVYCSVQKSGETVMAPNPLFLGVTNCPHPLPTAPQPAACRPMRWNRNLQGTVPTD